MLACSCFSDETGYKEEPRKSAVSAAAAAGMLVPLAACGSGTAGNGSADANGVTTIEWWGWEQGQQEQADAFNKS